MIVVIRDTDVTQRLHLELHERPTLRRVIHLLKSTGGLRLFIPHFSSLPVTSCSSTLFLSVCPFLHFLHFLVVPNFFGAFSTDF